MKVYDLSWKIFTYYVLAILYLGKPLVKVTFIENSEFYLVFIFTFYYLTLHVVELVINFLKNKSLSFSESVYFLIFLYIFFQLSLLEDISLLALKKFWILISFLICILIYNNKFKIQNHLTIVLEKINNYLLILSFLLFFQTLLGKAGTYGLIFYSNSYISQNLFDFKPQRIFIAILFTFLFLSSKKYSIGNLLLIVNTALLLSFSRIIVVMFVVSLCMYFILFKEYKTSVYICTAVTIFLLSGLVDVVGNVSNRIIVDEKGEEFIALVCARHLDDGIDINDKLLKELYVKRNVDYGQYPTLPRYFSFSNILESFNFIEKNIPELYYFGKKDICNNYSDKIIRSSLYVKDCNTLENKKCASDINNPDLFKSQSQSAQLGGNIEFRIGLWSKVIQKQNSEEGNKFIGLKVKDSLPKIVNPDINYGNLWHAHSSIFSIYGFFGFSGILLFLISLTSVIINDYEFDKRYLVIFTSIFILSISDGVLETPDLSILFSFFAAFLKNNYNTNTET